MSNINFVIDPHKAVLQPLKPAEYKSKGIAADVLRLDKIHPVISGNKWFKLKYYVEDARANHYQTILTYGGAWSNHIIATACMAKNSGMQSMGIIRGERPARLSATLEDAIEYGMQLEFIDRQSYQQKSSEYSTNSISMRYPDAYIIPEGGAGEKGIEGSSEILELVDAGDYTHILCCIGTGTMFHGLLKASHPGQVVVGIPVLKGMFSVPQPPGNNVDMKSNCEVIAGYDFGGYAKKTPALLQFMNELYSQTGIPTDFVYTGKLFYAFSDLVAKNYFPAGSRILLVHSGGLQGNVSLPAGSLLF